jgi:hypothetical protein
LAPADPYNLWLAALDRETREVFSQAELRDLWAAQRTKAAAEKKTRRRRAPLWDPDTDSPWRLLEHCFIAALEGCASLLPSYLETVIARGYGTGAKR